MKYYELHEMTSASNETLAISSIQRTDVDWQQFSYFYLLFIIISMIYNKSI